MHFNLVEHLPVPQLYRRIKCIIAKASELSLNYLVVFILQYGCEGSIWISQQVCGEVDVWFVLVGFYITLIGTDCSKLGYKLEIDTKDISSTWIKHGTPWWS